MKIIKLNNRVWKFEDVEIGEFSPSKFTINRLNNKVTVVYFNNLKSKTYNVADVEIYDIDAVVPFVTTNGDDFMLKLEELNCPCFQKDETTIIGGGSWGSITGILSEQTDLQTALDLKLDKSTTPSSVYATDEDGEQVMKPLSEIGSSETFAQSKWMFNDFYSANNPLNREPFMGAAVNGGSFNIISTNPLPEHQSYGVILSGTNANGGFRMITNNNGIRVQTGLTGMGIISLSPDASARDRVVRYGFHDTVNQNAPSNGVYVEILGSDLTFKSTSSSVTSASSTITLVNGINDLYEVMIYCTSGSDVRCIVNKIGTGVVLDANLTTNIPTTGLNSGFVATITTAGASNSICQLDYGGLGAVCPTFLQDRL
jgi:hypothetical protein